MSENFNKFYKLFGYDDSLMIYQMAKSLNTGEDCIKKSYTRYSCLEESQRLISGIRDDVLHDSKMNDKYFPTPTQIKEMNIVTLEHSVNPTKRLYIIYEDKKFIFKKNDEIIRIAIEDEMLIFFSHKNIFKIRQPFANEVRTITGNNKWLNFSYQHFPLKSSLCYTTDNNEKTDIPMDSTTIVSIIDHNHDDEILVQSVDKSCNFLVILKNGTEIKTNGSFIAKEIYQEYIL